MIKKFMCKYCGKHTERWHTPSMTAPSQTAKYLFCSRQCSSASRRTVFKKLCRYCGQEYSCWKSKLLTSAYCNNTCKYADVANVLGGAKNPVTMVCKHCKVSFKIADHKVRSGEGSYCSRKCANEGKVGCVGASLGKKFPERSGSNHHNWKGGITSENHKIRTSSVYKAWRKSVFERDDYTCQICNSRGNRLNADHIKPFALYPESRLDVNNGRTLCVDCHKTTPTWGYGTVKLAKGLN